MISSSNSLDRCLDTMMLVVYSALNAQPAGQLDAKLIVQAAATATPGTHAINIKAVAPFNGQQLVVEQPVTVVIEK